MMQKLIVILVSLAMLSGCVPLVVGGVGGYVIGKKYDVKVEESK